MSIPSLSRDESATIKISGPLLVGAAVIIDGGRCLISQRLAHAKIGAGKWEFPGGKVEPGEDPRQTVEREISEELGLEIEVGELFDVVSHVYQEASQEAQTHVVLIAYFCRLRSKTAAKAIGVAEVKWITSEEFSLFDFAAADQPLIEELVKRLR